MLEKQVKILKAYMSPRVFSMAVLGFPYGMMYYLAVSTLQTWLKDLNFSNTLIGLWCLVYLPSNFKFILAPFINKIKIPFLYKILGHRRSWLVLAHASLMFFLVCIGFSNPQKHLIYTIIFTVGLSIFAAIQDIVVDAYRIEILTKEQSGPGVGMLMFGYRMGSLMASAGALYLAEFYGWRISYLVMALFVFLGVIAALLNPEPSITLKTGTSFFKTYVVEPLKDLFERPGLPYILGFIVLYSYGDAIINQMLNPFLMEIGFTKPEIADITKVFGALSTTLGGFLGGYYAVRYSIFRALLIGGVAHSFAHLMLVAQAFEGYNPTLLYFVIATEKFTGGFAVSIFIVYLSKQCNILHTATQYALFSSVWSLSTQLASISGRIADYLNNWTLYFILSFIISLPGIIMIFYVRKFPFPTRKIFT